MRLASFGSPAGRLGEELAALLGAVRGEVFVDRRRELALLERAGEVVALVAREQSAARTQPVGEALRSRAARNSSAPAETCEALRAGIGGGQA